MPRGTPPTGPPAGPPGDSVPEVTVRVEWHYHRTIRYTTKWVSSMQDDDIMRILTNEESLAFLAAPRLGRLVTVIAGEPYIFPVNYVLHDSGRGLGTLYIRTAPGDKLFAATVTKTAAFEVDELTDTGACSVIARGTTRVVEDTEEKTAVESSGLVPWIASWKPTIIAVDLEQITGRQFVFGPSPEDGEAEVPG